MSDSQVSAAGRIPRQSWVAKLVTFVLIVVAFFAGAGLQQLRLERRPGSVADYAAETKDENDDPEQGLSLLSAADAINEMLTSFQAQTRGEALCMLAGRGHLSGVQELLRRGENVNAKDRHGATPLMNAARGGRKLVVELLLDQPGVDIDAVDDNGLNAYVYARASEKGAEVLELLTEHGAAWPTCAWPGDDPGLLQPGDLRDPEAVLGFVLPTSVPDHGQVASCIGNTDSLLLEAITSIDCGEQVNEPELRTAALKDRTAGLTLLLNRVIGVEGHVYELYQTNLWRHRKLPAAVMESVRFTRQQREADPSWPDLLRAVRKQNALIVAFVVGPSLRIPFAGGKSPVLPERMPIPPDAPDYVKRPLNSWDLSNADAEEVQNMINELLAAGGLDFGSVRLNKLYHDKGYAQLTTEPQLTEVQRQNLELLTARREELRAAEPQPEN